MRYRLDKPVRRRGARLLKAWRFSAGFILLALVTSLAFLHLGVSAQQKILEKVGVKKGPFFASSSEGSQAKAAARTQKKPSAKKATTSVKPPVNSGVQALQSQNCISSLPINNSLRTAAHPILQKLWEYQQVCGGDFLAHAMIFTAIPDSSAEVGFWANEISGSLKIFSAHGVKPMVVLEPSKNLNLNTYSTGSHDVVMAQYFNAIKAAGIQDAMMGQWVLFPEANIPAWGNTDPNVFSSNVTRTAQMLKSVFPSAKATIMLDSKTYPSDDLGYIRGRYSSLMPYVQNIPKGLLDSFGFQGFPWTPPANAIDIASIDAAIFLNANLAQEAAAYLGIKNIWLNSGSFQTYYAQDPARRVSYSPQQRQQIMNGIYAQALKLKGNGNSVTINVFAEDKTLVSEAVDWSYWATGAYTQSQHTAVFTSFAAQLSQSGIALGVFDTTH